MVTALLIIIYIAFIGLGLPHSLFGAAWPAIQSDFAVTLDKANYITILVSGCTVVSSMLGARLTNKWGTAAVVTASAFLAAVALFGFSISQSVWMMCVFAVPLGLGAGATDCALNNYIALHYSAMHMNFLHCFYGVGVMTSPYILSVTLDSKGWRAGYHFVLFIQLGIATILLLSLPFWKKVRHITANEEYTAIENVNLSYGDMIKSSIIRLDWLMCIAANAIEGVCGQWGSSYLVYANGFSEAKAAGAIMLFYIGIALGRFVSGVLSTKISSWGLIRIGTVIMFLGIIVLMLPISTIKVVGLLLVGLGNAPVHPNIIHLTPQHFGEGVSGSVVGSQMAAAYFGIMAAPPLFGFLARKINASLFPAYMGVWLLIFVASAYYFLKKLRIHKKNLIKSVQVN